MQLSIGPDDYTKDTVQKYAKRARHKTRATKYECQAALNRQKSQDATTTTAHKRKGSGAMLNENFKAANVDAVRVTLKPALHVGTYSKSKSSKSLLGRDLPDLTFTKMGFLSKIRDGDDAIEYTRG